MASITWKPNANGYWTTAANWSGGVEPGAADTVTLTSNAAHTIYYNTTDTVTGLISTDDLLTLQGGVLTVTGALSLAGGLNETGGTLALLGTADSIANATISDGDVLLSASTVLTLTGAILGANNNTYGARIHGPGTFITGGITAINDSEYGASYGAAVLGAGITWINTGTVNDAGVVVAYFTPGTAFTLINQAGAVYDFTTDDASIDNGNFDNNQGQGVTATSAITNLGLLEKTGGAGSTSYIYSALTSTGTINVANGTLALEGGGTIGGTLEGAGALALTGGNFLLAAGLSNLSGTLLIQNATVSLATSVSLAGGFQLTSGEVELGGNTLSLIAPSLTGGEIDGPGTLQTSGTITGTANDLIFGGGGVWINTGEITQSVAGYYTDLGDSTGAGTLINATGAIYDFANSGEAIGTDGGPGTFNNSGLLEVTGASVSANIDVSVQDSGTISVATSDTLQLNGNGTFSGAILGAGAVAFSGGIETLTAGTTLGVANLLIEGGSVLLNTSFNETNRVSLSGGTIELNNNTLSVVSPTLKGGTIDGEGSFITNGTVAVNYLQIGGQAEWINYGVVNDTGYIYGAEPDGPGIILNQAGAIFDLASNDGLYSNYPALGTFINAGELEKTAGTATSSIGDVVQDSGLISIATGALAFSGGGTFSGAISGPGTIDFAGGVDTLALGSTLAVSSVGVSSGTILLEQSFQLPNLSMASGTFDLDGNTLSLAKGSISNGSFEGPGTLQTAGTVNVVNVTIGGGADWINAGFVTESGSAEGSDNAGIGIILNQAGATFDFTSDFGLYTVGAPGTFINVGLLEGNAGTSYLDVQDVVQDTGTISVVSGTIQFDGGGTFGGIVSGKGTISFDGGTASFGNLTIAGTTALQLQTSVNVVGNTTIATAFNDNVYIALNGGDTLTLSGGDSFGNPNYYGYDQFDGPGAVVASGTDIINATYNDALTLSGGAVFNSSGTMTDSGLIQIGSADGGGTLSNTGVFDLNNDSAAITNGISYDIYGDQIPVIGTFTNAGSLAKNGGSLTNTIAATFINTGTVSTNTGTFAFTDGGTLGGKFATGSHISLASGDFFVNSLTEVGTLTDAAQIDQTGLLTLGSGSVAGTLSVTGVYNIDNDSSILLGTTAATTIAVAAGAAFGKLGGTNTSTIAAAITNNGSIFVDSGKLLLGGALYGSGTATIANGATLEVAGSTGTGVIITLGTSSDLKIDQTAIFKDKIANFVVGDTLDIGSLTVTSATASSGGILTLKNGTSTVGTLTLVGNHVGDVYTLGTDGAGGTFIDIASNASSWTGGTADWTVASDWSAGVPMSDTNATIAGTAAKTITLSYGENDPVNSLALSDAHATLYIGGALAIGTSFAQTAGTVELVGGTINNGTINVTAGDFAVQDQGTFNNVQFQGNLDLTAQNAQLVMAGGSITGANGTGISTIAITAYNAGLFVEGVETLNNVSVTLGNTSDYQSYLVDYDPNDTGALLTLGTAANVTQATLFAYIGDFDANDTDGFFNSGAITGAIAGGSLALIGNLFENDGKISITNGDVLTLTTNTFTNAGTLSVSGSSLVIDDTVFTNTGTLNVSGSTLTLNATSYTNTGSFAVTNSTVDLESSLTTGQLLSIVTGGDTLDLSGTLNNTGATLNLTTTTPLAGFTLAGGTIVGGTVLLPAGTLATSGGEILNATIDGGLVLNGTSLKVQGTQIESAAGTAPGAVSLTNASLEYSGYTDINNAILLSGGTIYITGQTLSTDLSTGIDANGNPLPQGASDPHFTDSYTGGPAAVLTNSWWTNAGIPLPSNAVAIGVYDSTSEPPPPYTFTETFTLTSAQAAIANLNGAFFIDNGGTLSINGNSIASDAYSLTTISDTKYFQTGLNTLAITLTTGDQNTDGVYFNGGLQAPTTIDAGATIQGTGLITDQPGGDGASAVINAGQIIANTAGGTLTIAPTEFYNSGILSASNVGVLALAAGTFANLVGTTLTGGTFAVAAYSTIELAAGTSITTNAADIILSGTSSEIQSYNGSTQITLESSLATIASGGTLALLAGRNYTSTLAVTDAGQLTLGGTAFTAKSLTIAPAGTLSGAGFATNTIADNGVIASSLGSTLKIGGATGTGTLLAAGGVLEVTGAAAATDTVRYAGLGATLAIDSATSFAATFGNLAAGDIIDFTSLASATAAISGTTLTVQSGANTYHETINSLPAGTVLATGTDGHGGTDITFYNQAAASLHSPEPVAFGQVHVGASLSQALAIANTAPVNGYSEGLDGSFATASAGVTTSGSFALLAPGATSTALTVSLATGTAGVDTGTAIITLASDGTGVDGLGTTSLGTQTVNLSATVFAYATASTPATVNLGQAHAGATLSQFLILDNSAAPGAYSENLDASFSGTSLGLTATGSISELAAGASSASALSLSIAPGTAGVASGTATLALISDGTGIDTLGTTTLTPQTITATGTLFNLATAATSASINLGQAHAGATLSQFLVLDNSAAPGIYSENLDASFSGTSLGLTAAGSVSELAAGASSTNALALSIAPGTAGVASGTTTLGLTSDGSGIDTLGTTTLTQQTITATGTLFNLATASAVSTLNFGQHHAGFTVTQIITIADTAAKGAYSENLDAHFSGTSSNLSTSGTISELAAGSSNSTSLVVTLHAGVGGAVTGATTINLTSDGTGIDSLGTTALTGDTLAVAGTLFNYATASITSKTLNFGIVHVGGTVDQYITLSNTAAKGSYSENLDASFSGTSSAFTTSGTLSKLAAGSSSSKTLEVLLNTGKAGAISATSTLKLTSDGSGIDSLGTTALSSQNVTITGTVNNYATASLETIAGAGTLTGSGTTLALNLGSVAAGGTLAETLGVLNSATGPADLLSGNFNTGTSAPFTDTGFNSFSGIAAGGADSTLGISLSDLTAGTYTETIVLDATGSNASGYSGTLAPETLVVTGTVTSGANVHAAATAATPRTMAFAAPLAKAAPPTPAALTGSEAFAKFAELNGHALAPANAAHPWRSFQWNRFVPHEEHLAATQGFAVFDHLHQTDFTSIAHTDKIPIHT